MKLKLSTLLVIIGVIFFTYYYFNYAPCQDKVQPSVPIMPPPPEEEGVTMLEIQENQGLTNLDTPFGQYENFQVTPTSKQSIQSVYDTTSVDNLAGNVRPDNAMRYDY